MSDQAEGPIDPSKLCVEPLAQTEVSKELTDKIHRLVRRWSRSWSSW